MSGLPNQIGKRWLLPFAAPKAAKERMKRQMATPVCTMRAEEVRVVSALICPYYLCSLVLPTSVDCRADQIVEVNVDPRVSRTQPDLTEDGNQY